MSARAVLLVLLAGFMAPASASAAEEVIAPLHITEEVKPIVFDGSPRLLVRSLTVKSSSETQADGDCGHCRRYAKVAEVSTSPATGVTRLSRLEWILRPRTRVHVMVQKPGLVGRYVVLRAAIPLGKAKLIEVTSGCLEGKKRVRCPEPERESPPPPPPPPLNTYPETVGGVTHTHTDYVNAGGVEGPVINPFQTVEVSCRVEGFKVEDEDIWWYRIASAPWSNQYYASADAFYNTKGQTSGSLIGTPPVDTGVRMC